MPDRMKDVHLVPRGHDPLAADLTPADDRILLNHWLPPQEGTVPRVRIGRRWVSVLWALPIAAVALMFIISLAQSLRELPGVQAFIREYGGIPQSAPSVDTGFPWWLRLQHFLNMLFMMFIIRAGIQILADHPRLYWKRDCTPGAEWFRFQKAVPTGRVWTSKDDSVTLPGWLGIPGIRHTIGLARWWHFSVNVLWVLNGVAFYVLLFSTDQWLRLVPVTKMSNMRHELTILAYDMNGVPLGVLHGAPLRLRCENELGFKMVKWIEAIEFVHDFADLGAGQGGYNEDHEFYGYRMPI